MRTWRVVFTDGPGIERKHPDTLMTEIKVFVRVQEYWNGNELRPCVGMRAEDASHQWHRDYFADFDSKNRLPEKLVPR